jgi:hypothetical protein
MSAITSSVFRFSHKIFAQIPLSRNHSSVESAPPPHKEDSSCRTATRGMRRHVSHGEPPTSIFVYTGCTFFCADLISGCVGNVSQELDFSFRYVRGFGAKFLLLQTLEDSRPQFKDLLFHRGSPPCFLPFDLLLWEGKDLAPGGIPTARPRLTLTTRILGTTSVQLRERKWSATILIPK